MYEWTPLSTLGPTLNGCYFPEAFSKAFCWNENIWILIRMSLKFFLNSPIGNILALAVIMAWLLTFYLIAHLPWYIYNGDYTREFKWNSLYKILFYFSNIVLTLSSEHLLSLDRQALELNTFRCYKPCSVLRYFPQLTIHAEWYKPMRFSDSQAFLMTAY